MELDELQALWQRQDTKLDQLTDRMARIVQRASLAPAADALSRLRFWTWMEAAVAFAAMIWLGSFTATHVRETTTLAEAIPLSICAIAFLAACVVQLTVLAAIDYNGPVIEVAAQIARVRLLRARTVLWSFAAGVLLWAPALLVAVRAVAGREVAAAFSIPWLLANVAIGIVVVVASVAIARRMRIDAASPRLRWLIETLSGGEVRSAARTVEAVLRYAQDDVAA
jgi:hypothetical protein